MERYTTRRKVAPGWDDLEGRQLLASAGRVMLGSDRGHQPGSKAVAAAPSLTELNQDLGRAKKDFEKSVVELRRMQDGSDVTRAEVLKVASDLAQWPPPGASIATILKFPDQNPASYDL